MDLPTQDVTLDVAQVEELCRHLSSFRHDVNGCLALVVAATELIRYNPKVIGRMANTLIEQPPKIAGKVREFIGQCERALGLRPPAEVSWYATLWKRSNLGASAPAEAVSLTPDEVKALHGEVVQLGKELTQLGFVIGGARSLVGANVGNAVEMVPNVADQFTKASLKYEQMATQFEQATHITEFGSRRLGGGGPAGPVTLTPEQVALFQRKLTNLHSDMLEHLVPLLELSRLARHSPQEIQTRASEFTDASPRISTELTNFAAEFDRTFAIIRAAQ